VKLPHGRSSYFGELSISAASFIIVKSCFSITSKIIKPYRS
jgi:hypothetical protein